MKYLLLILLVLAVAYIGGQQLLLTASAGDVMPAEALRVLDRASATAVVAATQAAQAQSTQRAGLANATAAAQQTRDSLALEQTRVALQLTAAAGAAMSTEMSGVKTQTAGQTAAAGTQAARQTSVWATPTVAALRTQAAVQAAALVRQQARSESVAEFWTWIRWTTVAALMALALVVCVLVLVRGLASIAAEHQRHRARTARDAFRVVSPGFWAEWQPDHGYQVYTLPGASAEAPLVIEHESTPSHVHAWRHTLRLFAWWGDRYGFGLRELGAEGAGVVSDPTWRRLTKLLKAAGVLGDVVIEGRKGRVTDWAPEWDYRRFADELGSGRLALPFPAGERPPHVAPTVPTQHQN